jgi:hypothetical protein
MPKANHVENTRSVDRLSILASAGGIAAAGALSTAAMALPAGTQLPPLAPRASKVADHRCKLRRARVCPGPDVFRNRADRQRDGRSPRPARQSCARNLGDATPKSWGDVVARAELAAYWKQDGRCDEAGVPINEDCGDCGGYLDRRSVPELISAVLTMAKGGANV